MVKNYPLTKNGYLLKTYNISKENTSSVFRDEGNEVFFIHPGEKQPSIGFFFFKERVHIILNFSIRKGSKVGDIEFTIKKNGKEIKKFIVTAKQKQQLALSIHANDKLEIAADKHGNTVADWGNLEIKAQEANYDLKNFIIPFLWSLLFIFLLGKNHKYIGINAYLTFIIILFAEKINFGPLHFYSILMYMLFIFAVTFIFVLIYQELWKLKKYKLASIISYISAISIYIVPLFFIIYALDTDSSVTTEILFTVFQSNSLESYEYVSNFISIKYLIFFIFITAFVGFLLYRQEKKETQKIEKSLLIFIIITFLSIIVTQRPHFRLPDFLMNGFMAYNNELNKFKEVKMKRKTGNIKFQASKKAEGETYIVVIGESLNKKFMGLYGYLRNTTPLLSKMNNNGELLVFNNVYSNHVMTMHALSLGLTEANQYNKKSYYDSLSIIDILNAANVETHWLEVQTLYGGFENLVTVIAESANNLVALTVMHHKETLEYVDGPILPIVEKVLAKKTNKNRVVFVHLIGSHFTYEKRYPKDKYSIYKGPLNQGEFGLKASKNIFINSYDNSVVYNDYIVSTILKGLKKKKGVNGFIYISDHGEEVVKALGHMPGKFTWEMTQIPMIAWFSDKYKEVYSKKYHALASHKNTLFSNDMLYNTMIGIFNIKTDKYDVQYDFSSDKYKLEPKNALALHGKKHYTDKSNYIYWQKENTKYLIDANQSSRILPHQVNTIGKLKDVWNDGFRSFKIDVLFGGNNTTTFRVGNTPSLSGVNLEKFLASIDSSKIQSILLDFKNIDNKNYKSALTRLEYLNEKYHLKNKMIIESRMKNDVFKDFSNNGWNTSYSLPIETIEKYLKEKNNYEMEILSLTIADQIRLQNISAISFDIRLYSWIKEYLEPKISGEVAYHVKSSIALHDMNFTKRISTNKLYLDKRVKTLSCEYSSQFYLNE